MNMHVLWEINVSSLCVRGCSPPLYVQDWWWPIWPMVFSPPSSGPSSCPSCGWWVRPSLYSSLLEVCMNSIMLFWYICFCAEQIRIVTNTFTLTPYNGAEALVRCRPVLSTSLLISASWTQSSALDCYSTGYLYKTLSLWIQEQSITV